MQIEKSARMKNEGKRTADAEGNIMALNMKHLRGCFFILGTGLLISLTVFGLELLHLTLMRCWNKLSQNGLELLYYP